ncbi:phosphopantetheine-binding protein [Gordonia sp. NPDC003585]|mgnify:FL=1|uniref:phosphopantetheine-binding protein n=1 Tax=Gordonia sp. NPDC003585 TaxID=3154275 RepID=UPI0033B5D11E
MTSNNVDTAPVSVEDVCTIVSGAIARRHGHADAVTPDSELLLTGLLDSLTLVNIVADLEQRIGQKLPEDIVVARNFRTPAKLHATVAEVLDGSTR